MVEQSTRDHEFNGSDLASAVVLREPAAKVPDALNEAWVGLSLRVGGEAFLRRGVEPGGHPHRRFERVELLADPPAAQIILIDGALTSKL